MMNFKIGIIVILVLAFCLRFVGIDKYPVHLSMDEVAIGYNAYSILKTGKDEWGYRMPLAFKSVGDYKPPVDVYLTVPSVLIFGLNELGVRFPVVLLGSLGTIGIMLVSYELSNKNKFLTLASGTWFAVNPWHIHFSRASFEAVSALTFLVFGLGLFLLGVRRKSYFIFGGSVFLMALSVWTYHAQRLYVPLLFLFLVFTYRKELKFLMKEKLKLMWIVLLFLILAIPFLKLTFFTPAIATRALSTSVFRESSLVLGLSDEASKYDYYYKIFRHIGGKYLNYYDFHFWFGRGGGFTPNGYPSKGLFYIVDLIFVPVGIYQIYFSKNEKLKKLLMFMFFVGPIPASLTMNEQHSLRLLVWLPFFAIASSYGLDSFKLTLVKYKALAYVFILIMTIEMVGFGDMYFRQFGRFYSEYWQFGYKEISEYACENKNKYEHIVISDTFGSEGPLNTGTPYLYYLFYCKVDPLLAQKNRGVVDNIIFRRVNWKNDKVEFKNSLIIGSPWDFGDELPRDKVIKNIEFLNGRPAFYIVKI